MDTWQTTADAKADAQPAAVGISVVVPFYNESEVVETLYKRVAKVLRNVGQAHEMVFVNDGSADGTEEALERIAREDERVVFVNLRRNYGQTTAIQAGFDHARGRIIIAMDGDLQHDPHEIPLFLAKLEEGYDIVSGWRARRRDDFLLRRLPSRVANWLLAKASGVNLRDFGTTFKAYRREVLEGVRLYGDMHRFIPAICARLGARTCEIPIKTILRRAGKSNYGLGRTFRVAFDLIVLRFTLNYLTRPMHFFGKMGMLGMLGGLGILGYGLIRKIVQWGEFHLFETHGPLMALGFMLVVVGMLAIALGLMGEMMMRIYFESTPARTYSVKYVVSAGRLSREPG